MQLYKIMSNEGLERKWDLKKGNRAVMTDSV